MEEPELKLPRQISRYNTHTAANTQRSKKLYRKQEKETCKVSFLYSAKLLLRRPLCRICQR